MLQLSSPRLKGIQSDCSPIQRLRGSGSTSNLRIRLEVLQGPSRPSASSTWKPRTSPGKAEEVLNAKRTSLTFNVGDLGLLNTRNLPIKTVNAHIELKKEKFAARKVGPFEIIMMISPNVARLKLQRNMKRLYSSLNVGLFSPYKPNASELAGRPIPKASRVILYLDTGEQLHIVEKWLRRHHRSRQPEWLVEWHVLPECDSTWEREKAISPVSHWQRVVQDFWERQREGKTEKMSVRRVRAARQRTYPGVLRSHN